MKRQRSISNHTLSRVLQSVGELWQRREFAPAIAELEGACRRDPGNLGLLLDLGRLHGLRYDHAAAEACFEKAIRLAPNKAQVLTFAGRQCRDFNGDALAERYFLQALADKNPPAEAAVKLAELYERQRRSDAAAAQIDRALQQQPGLPAALLVKARLERQAGRAAEAEAILRAFPAAAEPALRASAAYELGGILDRQGDYDAAMMAFAQAKEWLRPLATRPLHELQIMRKRLQHLYENLTPQLLQSWRQAAADLQPPRQLALLAGHPRSGTTLLEQVLDAHPDMVSAEETEIFYDDAYMPLMRGLPDDTAMFAGLANASPAALVHSRENYFRSMDLALAQPVGRRLLVDKNPSYTFLIPAFARIFPEIKFLIALRDPRDVVLSCYMQNLPMNQVGAAFLSLESTAAEYAALMSGWREVRAQLDHPWLEVRYEDMVEDLGAVARKTLEFLGVDWNPEVLGFDEHARKKLVRSPTYVDVTQPVYKRARGRWRNYQKHLEPHLEKLTSWVQAFGYE